MTLAAGSRLGPYEVLSPLGAGGMGEVYRARDTRLERTVAIKVLPTHLSSSEEMRQRFEREAKTISQISHPHICALYDVGREGDVEYLVMELLEGETLSARLAKGPLPLEQTLKYGVEIADALDKAHRQGVVHRDLKPGNVMLTKSGVKLLDFGLAKAIAAPSPSAGLTALPTAAPNLTQEGTILGTFQYMAPEQLEGRDADARTDIFAFGATLHEMATGEKAFAGATRASLISTILRDDPQPISQIRPMSPPALDRVVKTCLAKDPEDRFQTAHDVRLELKWVGESSQSGSQVAAVSGRRSRERLAWTVAGIAILAALLPAVTGLLRQPARPPVLKLSFLAPEKTPFSPIDTSGSPEFALSPDGRRMAFVASAPGQVPLLWVRSLDSTTAQTLPGTEDASGPFWSPDGRALGFFAQGKLKKVELSGAALQVLADAPAHRGGTWGRDGVILFTPNTIERLYRVSAAGSAVMPETSLDPQERSHRWPQFLPDGRHFLYLARNIDRERSAVYVGSLGSKERARVLNIRFRVGYSPPGYLLFEQGGALMAQPFDWRSLKLAGEPATVAQHVGAVHGPLYSPFSVSEAGVLAYWDGTTARQQLGWFDRGGKPLGSLGEPGPYESPFLSPDGQRVGVTRSDPQTHLTDIWLLSPGGTLSRFTFAPPSHAYSLWSPDGSRIAFFTNEELRQKASSGAGQEELLFSESTGTRLFHLSDWSSDGKSIVFQAAGSKAGWSIWVLRIADRKATAFLTTVANNVQGHLSPDGRWIAYASDESGRWEVYVQPFPATGGKWQISTSGGSQPVWRRDSKELFYMAAGRTLMAVPVTADSTFEAGVPRLLFQTHTPSVLQPYPTNYAVSADGQRFLVNNVVEEGFSPPITVVLNWTSELRK